MTTIYKYPISLGESVIELPEGAKPLTVQLQDNIAQMWVLVNTDNPLVGRKFLCVGTGQPIYEAEESYLRFVGTFQIGIFVWHLFEVVGE